MPDDNRNIERTLVLRLIDDDHKAFLELYVQYRKSIYLTAYGFVPSRDFAEDIYQDTFTTIWQIRKSLDPDASFSAFVFTVARNNIFNQLRQINKNDRLTDRLIARLTDTDAFDSDIIKVTDIIFIVNNVKEKFDKQQRIVYNLSRDHDMTYKEIAQALDIPVGKVKRLISKSLNSIRLSLAKYGILSTLLLTLNLY